jgi:hypothetical protein
MRGPVCMCTHLAACAASMQAMQHRGTLYMTTTEYFGAGTRATRVPSVYWAIVEPELQGMCHLHRKDWGVIASSEGLATGYALIAGTRAGAKLAYSYSGAGTISGGRYPAFPGEPNGRKRMHMVSKRSPSHPDASWGWVAIVSCVSALTAGCKHTIIMTSCLNP